MRIMSPVLRATCVIVIFLSGKKDESAHVSCMQRKIDAVLVCA